MPGRTPARRAIVEEREKKKPKIKLNTKSSHADYFMPMLEGFARRDALNEVIKNRVVKACDLLDAGVPLFPNDFRKEHSIGWVLENFGDLEGERLDAQEDVVAIAGRIVSLRSFGKVLFFHIQDQSGSIQCYATREDLPENVYVMVRKLDVGDIVGVSGHLFRTKTGELTIGCRTVKLITRSMRPLPEKYHGLKDTETRYRQRYVDLIVAPRTREIFQKRSLIVREFRRFLEDRGFMEVETPMMQPIAGGAAAKPFLTQHNALDLQLYMRIAPELYLKRLLVGGFEKVFELNRNFRNEGIDTRHNPEFTTCEFYWAYATYRDLMDLTEELVGHLAQAACGTTVVPYQGETISRPAAGRAWPFTNRWNASAVTRRNSTTTTTRSKTISGNAARRPPTAKACPGCMPSCSISTWNRALCSLTSSMPIPRRFPLCHGATTRIPA